MSKFAKFFQFFPIAIFLFFSRRDGWEVGFQIGALTAAIQFIVLRSKRLLISRLIAGANVFLIFGGISFYFQIVPFLNVLNDLMEVALFISVLLVTSFATIWSKQGAFEIGPEKGTRKYSIIFIATLVGCIVWSFLFRGNTLMAGTIPFLVLIGVKFYLVRRLFVNA